jgi:hypothetical protein
LEQKVDTIVSLLQSLSQTETSSHLIREAGKEINESDWRSTDDNLQEQLQSALPANPEPDPTLSPRHMSTTALGDFLASYNVSHEQAENCLKIFCSQMLNCFPFLNLPHDITIVQLHETHPFLCLCILTVTQQSASGRLKLGRAVKEEASKQVIVRGEGNIDLLLGLLTFAAW